MTDKRLKITLGLLVLTGFSLTGCQADTAIVPDLDKKIGQMIMVGFRGTEISETDTIAQDISAGRVGGVILFNRDVELKSDVRNITNPEQLARLTTQLHSYATEAPLLVAIDQEGGRVARLNPSNGFAATQSAAELGAAGDTNATEAAAYQIGQTLAAMGINLNFAPVVDVNVNPDNPAIGRLGRSFSADPQAVTDHGLAYLAGLHKAGVLGCIKHFPGHGSAFNDSHYGVTDVTDTTLPEELEPFRNIITARQCDIVMTAHIFNANLDAEYPATLSEKTIRGLLRTELGYNGVVITDDLQMAAIASQYGLETAVIKAVNAGVDILLFGNNLGYDPALPSNIIAIIKTAINDGTIDIEKIEQANQRIKTLKGMLKYHLN